MASTIYIAASVNRSQHAASIARISSRVLFGSHKFIAYWDSSDILNRGILRTLPGHDAEVTAVKWIEDGVCFCSADQAGCMLVWRLDETYQWKVLHKIQAQSRGISALAYYDQTIVTGSSEGFLKIFNYGSNDMASPTLLQTIDLKARYPLAIELSKLPRSSAVIMAVATTDRNIKIFTRGDDQFVSSLSLEGHEDWVKCLALTSSIDEAATETLVLASGSQDGYIRLWLVAPLVVSEAGPQAGPVDELMDAFERSLGEMSDDAEEGGKKISNRAHVFAVHDPLHGSKQFSLTFDALLVGHEAGVTSLAWQPREPSTNSTLTLLSTSTDHRRNRQASLRQHRQTSDGSSILTS